MKKFGKILVVLVIVAIILVALITGTNILFFWSIFNYFQQMIMSVTGIDVALAKGLAALILALVIMLPLGSMALSLTPIPQKNKLLYRSIIFSLVALFFFFAYIGSVNMYFDAETGLPKKFYSISVSGEYKFYNRSGFDTETGDSLKPVTKEIVLKSKGFNLDKKKDPIPEQKINYTTPIYTPIKHHESSSVNKHHKSNKATEIISKKNVETPKKTDSLVIDKKPTQEPIKEKNYGYSISILENKDLSKLTDVFRENYGGYSYYGERLACQTIFINNASVYFDVLDNNKKKLFKIPSKTTMTIIMDPCCYYLKPGDSFKYVPLNIPNRSKFIIRIENDGNVEPGNVFTGTTSSNRTYHGKGALSDGDGNTMVSGGGSYVTH